MTEYSEQELQANLADILDNLKAGQTVRITRNGKTCGMLTGVYHGKKEPLSSLEGALLRPVARCYLRRLPRNKDVVGAAQQATH